MITRYLASIGRKGGKMSRRELTSTQSKNMIKVREARRAFRRFYTECFWSFDEKYNITLKDVAWVVRELRRNGNRQAWEAAEKLCR